MHAQNTGTSSSVAAANAFDGWAAWELKQEGPRALDHSPESWQRPVAKEISLKDISIFSSGGHVVQLS